MMTKYKRKMCGKIYPRWGKKLESLSKDYMDFLDKAKTERLAASEIVKIVENNGYISLDEKIKEGSLKKGNKGSML